MTDLAKLLLRHQDKFQEVIKGIRDEKNLIRLDLSENNRSLVQMDLLNTITFSLWLDEQLNHKIGWGGYMEHREIYRRSRHFDGDDEPRSLHLGIDLWAAAGTDVFCPMPAVVHSFRDNQGFGNYGPTMILEHSLEGIHFYTLYGHLSRNSLRFGAGDKLEVGACLGYLGNEEENGFWPPHLHFQVMADMWGNTGDFPGVAKVSEKARYLENCPDPNLILKCRQ